jgi:hypothetical protein
MVEGIESLVLSPSFAPPYAQTHVSTFFSPLSLPYYFSTGKLIEDDQENNFRTWREKKANGLLERGKEEEGMFEG